MKKLIEILEIIFYPITFLVSKYVQSILKRSPSNLRKTFNLFIRCGWLPINFHYYQPIIKIDMLPKNYDKIESSLSGINFDVNSQLNLLNKFHYGMELRNISKNKINDFEPFFNNKMFPAADSQILYNMIRHYKPKKIIEIGSGESTKFAKLAIDANEKETNVKTDHICIEPFENLWLEKLGVEVIRKNVETLDVSFFKKLSKNDFLFIDSSHVIRTQGDVVFEYLEIIPRLNNGVIVHCHDIFIPREYPIEWIEIHKRFWNEQYLLQAVLTNVERYKILLSINYLSNHHNDNLRKACPILNDSEGASFWFQIVK